MGDIIKEINGQDVTDPDQLTEIMKKTSGSVTLKVLPSYYDAHNFSQVSAHIHTRMYICTVSMKQLLSGECTHVRAHTHLQLQCTQLLR